MLNWPAAMMNECALPERREERNHLPSLPAIHAKVLIGREYLAAVCQFGHANETGIRQRDRLVGVLAQQPEHVWPVVIHREVDEHKLALDQLKDRVDVESLGRQDEDGF